MNIIEQLGGYKATKEKYQALSDSDMITIGPVEFSAKDYFEDELLEYRRQHNIYEVGDKVVGSKLFDDRIFEFQYYLPELSMAVISKDGAAIGLNQLRHATDAEIKAGKRS